MAQDIGVVVIHGMGSQQETFAAPMIDRLKKEVRKRGGDPDRIEFGPLYWANALKDREERLLNDASAETRLDFQQLRRFVISNLADAVAYHKTVETSEEKMPKVENERPVYTLIHETIAHTMNAVAKRVRKNAPLVVIAHSLGCHIMSNYIWDATQSSPNHVVDRRSPFETCTTLTAIAMFGCNMPLFLLSNERLVPIQFPGKNIGTVFPGKTPAQIEEVATWRNYLDADDVLAWPLRSLGYGYEKLVKDVQVNAGGFLSAWNPMVHDKYWNDKDVIKPIGETLAKILALL